jgi:hypothetical protein
VVADVFFSVFNIVLDSILFSFDPLTPDIANKSPTDELIQRTFMMMRFFLLWSFIAVVGTEAFAPHVNHHHRRHHDDAVGRVASSSLMAASSEPPPSNNQHAAAAAAAAGGLARFFGLVAAASVLSLNIVDPASAANNMLKSNDCRISST